MNDSSQSLLNLWPLIDAKCYFDLSPTEQATADSAKKPNGQPLIEAWTFVPHPELFKKLGINFHRYIVMIDTMSSDVYEPVLEFLTQNTPNLSTYYSGGYADFICDLNMLDTNFESWKEQLCTVLRNCNAQIFVKDGGDVSELLKIYRAADNYLIRCNEDVEEFGAPTRKSIEAISKNLVQFEHALRDYKSPETLESFNGDTNALRNYLLKLKSEKIIMCFRVIADTSRSYAQDYVAFGINNTRDQLPFSKALVSEKSNLLKPVKEFFKVDRITATTTPDPEIAITHILINSYNIPGERSDWKKNIYYFTKTYAQSAQRKIDVNTFNYPLEGTINESPIYLSDYPAYLQTINNYKNAASQKGFFVGTGIHPSESKNQSIVELSIEGISQNGAILGTPGSGKTNTGLVVASGLLRHVKNVFLLDSTNAIGKNYSASLANQNVTFVQHKIDTIEQLDRLLIDNVDTLGLIILDCKDLGLPKTLDCMVKFAEGAGQITQGTNKRGIEHALIVEEAQDAWIGNDSINSIARATAFHAFLNKSYRSGWTIWLSTQRPGMLGADAATSSLISSALRNRLIHGALSEDKQFLSNLLKKESYSENDIKYFNENIKDGGAGKALLCGMKNDTADGILPPLLIAIPMLNDLKKFENLT